VFPVCIALSVVGTVLVTLGDPGAAQVGGTASEPAVGTGWYGLGVASALCSAVAAGLLPVLTRKSKEAHWATVELWSAAGASLVFTPLALLVWLSLPAIDGLGDSRPAKVAEMWAAAAAVLRLQPLFFTLMALSLIGFAGLALQTYGYQVRETPSWPRSWTNSSPL
jgi:hypothetical protein